jgi:hypothetical protein
VCIEGLGYKFMFFKWISCHPSGMIYKYFSFKAKNNSLTSVSLVPYELSVSLYELNEFFKVSFGNRLRLAVNLKFGVNILDVSLGCFL